MRASSPICKGLGAKKPGRFNKSSKIQPLSLSFHCHLYKMDERRQKVLVAFVFFMAVRHVMAVVAILQKLALHQHYVGMAMVFAMMVAESGASRRTRSIWMYDRSTLFADKLLFGCYSVKLFKQHTRLLPETFDYFMRCFISIIKSLGYKI